MNAFDVARSGIELAGKAIDVRNKEFDLALFLFRNVGRLLSRRHLTEAVWGIEGEVHSRSLDTHISRLRTKLRLHPANGFRLYAVYSVGYRLEVVNAPKASALDLTITSGDAKAEAARLQAPRTQRATRIE